jgi:hypothetical protein
MQNRNLKMNINKLKYALSVVALISGIASANDKVRLVVTPKTDVVEASSKQNSTHQNCVYAPYGETKWCIGHSINGMAKQASISDTQSSKMKVIEVDGMGYTSQEVKNSFIDTGLFKIVELDVKVSTISKPKAMYDMVTTASVDNDPGATDQSYYFGDNESFVAGSNISTAQNIVQNNNENVDVFVLDSGFHGSSDFNYFSG